VVTITNQGPFVCVRNVSIELNVELQAEFIIIRSELEAALFPSVVEVLAALEVGSCAHLLDIRIVLAFL